MESKKDPEKGKKKKEKREKPKYNLWQNTGFMLRAAFNSCKSVPFMCLALVLTASGKAVLELLVTPTVLSGLEGGAGLGSLMLTIVLFTAGLFIAYCLENYLKNVALFGRISVREGIILLINKKRASTSYQNISEHTGYPFLGKMRKGHEKHGGQQYGMRGGMGHMDRYNHLRDRLCGIFDISCAAGNMDNTAGERYCGAYVSGTE